jgi:hypothetical protein
MRKLCRVIAHQAAVVGVFSDDPLAGVICTRVI